MAAIGTVTILLNLMLVNDVAWILLRALSGFCFAGAAMIVESWLNEVADNRSRGTIFSIYVTINMAASTVGQLAMSMTGVTGYMPFVVGAISFICARAAECADLDAAAAAAAVGAARSRAALPDVAGRGDRELLGRHGQRYIRHAGAGLWLSPRARCRWDRVPVLDHGDRRGARADPGGPALGRDRPSHHHRGAAGLAALVGLVLVVADPSGPGLWLYVLFGIYGFAAYPIYAIAVAHANDFAEDGEFAKVAGGMLLMLGVGLAIGPAVASSDECRSGRSGLFIVTATFHGALAVTAFLRMRIRPIRDAKGRVRFRVMDSGKAGDAGGSGARSAGGRNPGKPADGAQGCSSRTSMRARPVRSASTCGSGGFAIRARSKPIRRRAAEVAARRGRPSLRRSRCRTRRHPGDPRSKVQPWIADP